VYGVLGLLALVGLVSPGQFNIAPVEGLLEVVFLGAALLSVRRMRPAGQVLVVVAGTYVLVKTLLLLFFSQAGLIDHLLAYKSFYYLVLLGAFVGSAVFDRARLARFTAFLVAVFLVKYGYSVVLGLADRPGVYLENNFELIMLIGLFLLAHPYLGARRDWLFGALTLTVLLSGSRSAALGLLVVYVFLYVRTSHRTWPLHVAGVAVVGYVVLRRSTAAPGWTASTSWTPSCTRCATGRWWSSSPGRSRSPRSPRGRAAACRSTRTCSAGPIPVRVTR